MVTNIDVNELLTFSLSGHFTRPYCRNHSPAIVFGICFWCLWYSNEIRILAAQSCSLEMEQQSLTTSSVSHVNHMWFSDIPGFDLVLSLKDLNTSTTENHSIELYTTVYIEFEK